MINIIFHFKHFQADPYIHTYINTSTYFSQFQKISTIYGILKVLFIVQDIIVLTYFLHFFQVAAAIRSSVTHYLGLGSQKLHQMGPCLQKYGHQKIQECPNVIQCMSR